MKDPFSLFIEDSAYYSKNEYYKLMYETKRVFFDYLYKNKTLAEFKKETEKINKEGKLLRIIEEKYVDALEIAISEDDAISIHNIMNNFSLELYREYGVWFETFDYYDQYGDNLNGYVSLLICRIHEAESLYNKLYE